MSMTAESLERLVNGIVDEPEVVRVNERSLCRGKLLEVRVAPADLGRVVDRNRRTVKALRCVATALLTNGLVRIDVIDRERHREKPLSQLSREHVGARMV